MHGLQKVLFLALVCFFGSASVFVAGIDLQRRLQKHTTEQTEHVKKLIQQLRGETLDPNAKAVVSLSEIPTRKGRSYLSDNDKSRIKRLFTGLASSDANEPQGQPELNKDNHVPSESMVDDNKE